MSPLEFSCPSCRTALRVRGVKAGQRIRCTKCNEVFAPPVPVEDAVPTAQPAEPPASPAAIPVAAQNRPAQQPAAKSAPGEDGNPLSLDDDPPRPKPRAKESRKSEPPAKARKPRKRRDEDERPAAAINPVLLVGGLAFLVLLVFGVGAFAVYRAIDRWDDEMTRRDSEQAAADRRESARFAQETPKPRQQEAWKPPAPVRPPAPEPEPVRPAEEPAVAPPLPPFNPPVRPPVRPPAFEPPAVPPGLPPGVPPNFAPNFPGAPDPKPAGDAGGPLVRAAANPAKITATKAADKAELKLPGTVDYTCFGGGGRYVLMRIPSVKKVAVLDVCEGKVTKYLPIPEDGSLIAAGNEHLFVLSPTANVTQRWSLTTFEKQETAENPLKGAARKLLVGHATDGPVFVVGPNQALDPKTFKPVAHIAAQRGWGMAGHPQYPPTVNVSADGRVFAWHTQGLSPSGLSSMVLGETAEGTKMYNQHDTFGVILPGPDGTLFTGGGLFTPELKPIGERGRYQYWHHAPIPAAHGKFYVHIPPDDSFGEKAPKVELRMVGENKALLDISSLDGLDVPRRHNQTMAKGMQLHDRVFLVPDAEALAVLHGTADRVTIHKMNIEAALAKAGIDYLFVASQPPAASCGKPFRYKPEVKSRLGGVKVKLESGPDSMEVEADGTVAWKVPENFADTSVRVILTISDKSGQETFHTFTLPVSSRP